MLARKYVKALRRKELLEEKEKCKGEVQQGKKAARVRRNDDWPPLAGFVEKEDIIPSFKLAFPSIPSPHENAMMHSRLAVLRYDAFGFRRQLS